MARIYEDGDGKSHYDEINVEFDKAKLFDADVLVKKFPSQATTFVQVEVGFKLDWHPAPRKQIVTVLKGIMEIEVGDGEKRQFSPGDTFLVEDTEGQGHISRNLGDEPLLVIFSHLE